MHSHLPLEVNQTDMCHVCQLLSPPLVIDYVVRLEAAAVLEFDAVVPVNVEEFQSSVVVQGAVMLSVSAAEIFVTAVIAHDAVDVVVAAGPPGLPTAFVEGHYFVVD